MSPLALANTVSIQLCSPLSGADTRRQAPRYTATLRAVSGAMGSTQQAASVPSAATRTLSWPKPPLPSVTGALGLPLGESVTVRRSSSDS